MAAPSPSSFIFRDFIQYIFPTLIAACLFVPFSSRLNSVVSFEGLFFGAAILGYIISSPLTKLVNFSMRYIPIAKGTLREYEKRGEWIANNWNFERLFFVLSNDEREYIYLTSSYAEFYRFVGFYLLIYFVANVAWLLSSILPDAGSLAEVWRRSLGAATPMLKNVQVPTLLLLLITPVLSYFLFRDFFTEYEAMFLERGQYAAFAEKYHLEKGNIAVSIWGKVLSQGEPVAQAQIKLLSSNYEELDRAMTDEKGHFQFVGKYAECLNSTCHLYLAGPSFELEQTLLLSEKQVPYVEIDVSRTDAANAQKAKTQHA